MTVGSTVRPLRGFQALHSQPPQYRGYGHIHTRLSRDKQDILPSVVGCGGAGLNAARTKGRTGSGPDGHAAVAQPVQVCLHRAAGTPSFVPVK